MKKILSIIAVLTFLIGTAFLPPLIKSDGGTPYIDAADIRITDSGANFTATNVETVLPELLGIIPDNISDLTISADIDASDEKIVNLADGTSSGDAINLGQLNDSHSLAVVGGIDGDTIVLNSRQTILALDGAFGDPATVYIDGSNVPSGSKIYIKYLGFSGNATLDRDDDNDPGNFLGTSAGSGGGTSTLTFTGTGTSMLLKSGATWYQMY